MSGASATDPPLQVAQLEDRIVVLTAFVGGILFELDRAGRYLEVWTGEPDLLAQPEEQLRGSSITEVLGPDRAAPFLEIFERVVRTGVPETIDYTLDVQAGRRSFRAEARRTPRAHTHTGEDPTITLLVRDVTDETELRAKLVEAERLAAMGLVAASVGHELRQPLAFATTSVEVLAHELPRAFEPGSAAGQRSEEALAHVRDALHRMAAIASNVGVVAQKAPEDATLLRRPIFAALDLCASELRELVDVKVDLPEQPLPRVPLSEAKLCQVFTNLVLNAAHAVRDRRAAIDPSIARDRGRITIRGRCQAGRVHVVVTDDGCGVPPEHLPRIFDPFFTTKAAGRGTGLGLFVSKRIVEAVGGALRLESQVETGTRVELVLPIASDTTASPPSKTSAKDGPRPGPPRRLKILVVDDERVFLRSLELVLGELHDVVVCERSTEALALVQAAPDGFDAILCDLSMPEIDGVAFYGHVLDLGIGDRFILMTAGAFTARSEAFLEEATCRRIGKPFTQAELEAVLADVAG